jgi:hypothetical protein
LRSRGSGARPATPEFFEQFVIADGGRRIRQIERRRPEGFGRLIRHELFGQFGRRQQFLQFISQIGITMGQRIDIGTLSAMHLLQGLVDQRSQTLFAVLGRRDGIRLGHQ